MISEKARAGIKRRKMKYLAGKVASAPFVNCGCGCGVSIRSVDDSGRAREFLPGHNGKVTKKWADRAQLRREWNHRNKPSRRALRIRLFRKRKVALVRSRGSSCLDCGIQYDGKNACIFHFHHRDPTAKSWAIGNQLVNKAWVRILEEAAKCDMICANCHEKRHSGEF